MGYINPSTLLVALAVCLLFYGLSRLPEIGGELLAGIRFERRTPGHSQAQESARPEAEQEDKNLPHSNS